MEYESSCRPSVGRYDITRSSFDKSAMLAGEPKYDKASRRWFESYGCDFACWRDCKALWEADDMDIEVLHLDNPDMNARESDIEISYGKTKTVHEYIHVLLMEYQGKRHRTFSFEMYHVTEEECVELEKAVMNWHATGELKSSRFYCKCWEGAWDDN